MEEVFGEVKEGWRMEMKIVFCNSELPGSCNSQ